MNKALNFYLDSDYKSFVQIFSDLEKIEDLQESYYLSLLHALLLFHKGEYSSALYILENPDPKFLGEWLKRSFQRVMNAQWIILQKIRCKLFMGDFLVARKEIEEQLPSLFSGDKEKAFFLLGMTYIEEAKKKPFSISFLYDKRAFSYFMQLPLANRFFTLSSSPIRQRFQKEFIQSVYEEEYERAGNYLYYLNAWKNDENVLILQKPLSEHIQQLIEENKNEQLLQCIVLIDRFFKSTDLFFHIKESLLISLTLSIENKNKERFVFYSSLLGRLQENSQDVEEEHIQIVEKEVEKIMHEGQSLDFVEMDFLFGIAKSNHQLRLRLFNRVFNLADSLLIYPEQSLKFCSLMHLLKRIPLESEEQLLQEKVERWIRKKESLFDKEEKVHVLSMLSIIEAIYGLEILSFSKEKAKAYLIKHANGYDEKRKKEYFLQHYISKIQ